MPEGRQKDGKTERLKDETRRQSILPTFPSSDTGLPVFSSFGTVSVFLLLNIFMGENKTLTEQKAVEKIKELADGKICMFCTYEDFKMITRPMSTSAVDEDGALWFFSDKNSHKNYEIKHNQQVDLLYMDTGKHHYLVLNGIAEVIQDENKAREVWSPLNKVWFEGGAEDSDLSLIKVVPAEGHYWDTRNGKLVAIIKIAIAAVTGKETYYGAEGDILT